MTTTVTLESLAREASESFETATRNALEAQAEVKIPETFVRLKEGAPDWVGELVYAAHGGDFLPDDWRYSKILDALYWLTEGNDPDDSGEFADSAVDVYTEARIAWLGSNLSRASYVDQAAEDLGTPHPFDVVDAIGLGQYTEASEVFGLVVRALEDRLEQLSV